MPIFIPDAVQTQYDRVLSNGLPGSVADANPAVRESFVAEGGNIPYGIVISRGSIESLNGNTQTGRLGKTGLLAATKGYVIGTGIVEQDMAVWNAISDGAFKVSIDGVENTISACDTSGAADLDAVAVILQARIRIPAAGGFTLALCTYDSVTKAFTITSGVAGAASSVSDLSVAGSGTEINVIAGLDTGFNVSGDAATTLVVLGITQRTLISESVSVSDSASVATKEGEVGAVVREGTIKVLAKETAADRGDVYYDDATGEIYASAGAGLTQLGSAKFVGAVQSGSVGVVDIVGVR